MAKSKLVTSTAKVSHKAVAKESNVLSPEVKALADELVAWFVANGVPDATRESVILSALQSIKGSAQTGDGERRGGAWVWSQVDRG